jgi:hypothetical protein
MVNANANPDLNVVAVSANPMVNANANPDLNVVEK